MIGIAIFLLGAALAYGFARWLQLPLIPLLVVTGVAIGQFGHFPVEILEDTLVLGITFLLFITGIELNPRRVRAQRVLALWVGLVQFVVLGVLGVGLALLLRFDLLTAVYLGLALTASSTLVIVRQLQRRRQLFEPFGRLVVGVLLVQDVLVILLVPLVTLSPKGVLSVAGGFFGTLALVGLAFVCLRWVTPRLLALQREGEVLLLAALSILFVFIGLAHVLALPLAAGAFLAGVSLSGFPVSGIIRGPLYSVFEFFAAIFFTALGGLVGPPNIVELGQALAMALLVLLVTPPLVTVIAERMGFAARPAIESGLLLSQTSELSLVVGLQALVAGQIEPDVFSMLGLVTVITMVLTPLITTDRVVAWTLGLHPLRREAQGVTNLEDHVLLLGCGSGGMPLLETLLTAGQDVVVVDDDPEIIERLRRGDVPCIRGDASDPDALREAGAERAKVISSTIRRPRDNQQLLQRVRGVPILVRVFDDEDAEWVREMGGIPVLYSAAAAEDFLRWFERHFPSSPVEEAAHKPVREQGVR